MIVIIVQYIGYSSYLYIPAEFINTSTPLFSTNSNLSLKGTNIALAIKPVLFVLLITDFNEMV